MNLLTYQITQAARENNQVAEIKNQLLTKYPHLSKRKLLLRDLKEIIGDLPYLDSPVLLEFIFAIFSIENGPCYESFIVSSAGCYRVHRPPNKVVSQLLYFKSNIRKMETVCQVYSRIFDPKGKAMFYLPFIQGRYTLMPLGAVTEPTTSWVNPAHLEGYITDGLSTYLDYSFGLIVDCPLRTVRTVIKRMKMAFKAFGIYKRDVLQKTAIPHDSLTSYLELRWSPLVQKVTENLTTGDIPGDKGAFETAKQDYFDERVAFHGGNTKKAYSKL